MNARKIRASMEQNYWVRIADRARSEMESAAHGDREATLKQLNIGAQPNTIRRSLAAAAKVPILAKVARVPADVLRTFPLAAIEALARWMAYDPKQAAEEVKAVRDGKSSRQIVADELEARLKKRSRVWGNSAKAAAREFAKEFVRKQFTNAREEPRSVGENDAIDGQFSSDHGSVALLVFGPYQDVNEHRVAEFTQRVIGLCAFHEHVVAAVPQADVKKINKCIDTYRARADERERYLVFPKVGIVSFSTDDAIQAFRERTLTRRKD